MAMLKHTFSTQFQLNTIQRITETSCPFYRQCRGFQFQLNTIQRITETYADNVQNLTAIVSIKHYPTNN